MLTPESVAIPGASAAAALEAVDPDELSDLELVAYLQAWERQSTHATAMAWNAARQVADRTVTRVSNDPESVELARIWCYGSVPTLADRTAGDEVRHALHLSVGAAQTQITRGRVLHHALPATGDALKAAEITVPHALIMMDKATELTDPDLIHDLEHRVLPRAPRQTPGDFGKSIKRAIHVLDPKGTARRHRDARRNRGVSKMREQDGMSGLSIPLPEPEAERVYTILDTLARAAQRAWTPEAGGENGVPATPSGTDDRVAPVDGNGVAGTPHPSSDTAEAVDECGVPATPSKTGDRPEGVDEDGVLTTPPQQQQVEVIVEGRPTLANLRAEALLCLIDRAASDPTFPTAHGKRRIETQIVITLETVLGLRDDPATINGHSVPADIARELAADSTTVRRLLVDDVTGHLVEASPGYDPSQALTDFLIVRDGECRVPHCHLRASACDLDHAIPWDQGGATSPANLGALCRSHHTLKTAGHTDLINSAADGSGLWITALGQRVPIPPRPVLPPTAPAVAEPGQDEGDPPF